MNLDLQSVSGMIWLVRFQTRQSFVSRYESRPTAGEWNDLVGRVSKPDDLFASRLESRPTVGYPNDFGGRVSKPDNPSCRDMNLDLQYVTDEIHPGRLT